MVAIGVKQKLKAKPVSTMGISSVSRPDLQVYVLNRARRGQSREAATEQLAVVNARAKNADQRRSDKGTQSSRSYYHANRKGRIAQDLLIVKRQNGDGDVEARPQTR